MSERLTARSPKNNMAYLVNVKENEQALDGSYDTLICVRDVFEALAVYEETAPKVIEALRLYEEFETLMMLDDGVWENEILPRFTKSLYDRWIEIQSKRNEVLREVDGKEVTTT